MKENRLKLDNILRTPKDSVYFSDLTKNLFSRNRASINFSSVSANENEKFEAINVSNSFGLRFNNSFDSKTFEECSFADSTTVVPKIFDPSLLSIFQDKVNLLLWLVIEDRTTNKKANPKSIQKEKRKV